MDSTAENRRPKRPYEPPRLIVHGRFVDITHGQRGMKPPYVVPLPGLIPPVGPKPLPLPS